MGRRGFAGAVTFLQGSETSSSPYLQSAPDIKKAAALEQPPQV